MHRLSKCAPLDRSGTAWDGDRDSRCPRKPPTLMCKTEEMPDHFLTRPKMRNDTAPDWTDGFDMPRQTLKHLLCLGSH
jgi:hypothetical protein